MSGGAVMSTEARPFFSVVIPTKNRPALLRDAIRSVVLQEFDDVEAIVSDNCNDDRTRQTVDHFRADARLRYVRTDAELPMPDHWEFATTKARGRYVLVLTDRSVLTPRALATIHRVITSSGDAAAVCSWRWALYDDTRRILLDSAGGAPRGKAVVVDSVRVAEAFVNKSGAYPYALPRGLNSSYRDDVGRSIRDTFGRLFGPVSPDFTSAFLLLAHTPRVTYIDDPLFISQGLSVSNGGKGIASTARPYLETLGLRAFYEHVPIKAPIVENVIMNDFLSVQRRAGGNLAGVALNWVEYFAACYRELLEKEEAGLLAPPVLAGLFAEWGRALAGFDPATRDAVRSKIARLKTHMLKRVAKHSPLGPSLARLKRALGASRRFESALGAAGFRPETP